MRVFALLLVACVFGAPPAAPPRYDSITVDPSPVRVAAIQWLGDALSDVALNPAQRQATYNLGIDMQARHKNIVTLRGTLAIDLAASVEQGALDEARILADADAIGHARADVAGEDAKALDQLHQILDPSQRQRFSANAVAKAKAERNDDFKARFAYWREALNLSPQQEQKILAGIDASAGKEAQKLREERIIAAAEAFKTDGFSGAQALDPNVAQSTHDMGVRLIEYLKVILPELAADQRGTAAALIRSQAGVGTAKPKPGFEIEN